MSVLLVFNELSIIKTNTWHDANRVLGDFIVLLKACAKAGTQRIIRVQEDFINTPINDGYTIHDWCKDSRVDKETRLYLLLKGGTEYPVVKSEDSCEVEFHECDFYHSNRRALGLGAAHLLEGLCLSMNTAPQWEATTILIEKEEVTSTGELVRQVLPKPVNHASLDQHLTTHQQWISRRHFDKIQTGADIWKNREELFANLSFCGGIETTLNKIGPNNPWFRPVKDILELLNANVQTLNTCFKEGQLGSYKFADESTETKKHAKCRSDHVFKCQDGRNRDFFWHVKGPDALRVYLNYKPPIIYIGYIGHLPISSSPNFSC